MSPFATVSGSQPLRVIQVGAGGMGRMWLDLLSSDPLVDVVGLVDLDTELAQHALDTAGIQGVAVAARVTDLAATVGAHAVINVTVPQAHHAVTTEALFLGLPVLSEKPIAPTVAQALSLAAASEVTGQLLMTSQSRRYYDTLAQFRQQAQSLGRLGFLSTEFSLAPRFGGFRDTMAHPLLVDMAIHPFDVARYLLGSVPVSVYCESFNPPWSWYAGDAATTAVFEFDGGVRYTFIGSWCSTGLETSWNGSWRVSGEYGSATWDGENPPVVDRPDTSAADAFADPAQQGKETIAGALDEFVNALKTGKVPSGEVHSNLLSLAMVESATRSADTGERVIIAGVLDSAHTTAVAAETHPEVSAVLRAAAPHFGRRP